MRSRILKSVALGVSLLAMPALAATPDGLITSKTKLSLWTTDGIRSSAVHVDTTDGVVTLYGKVPTSEQKAVAEKTTREIAGVRGVNSLLQVVPEAQEKGVARSDKDTKAMAEKALKAEPALKDSTITVKSVDKGVVLLTGEARSLSDHLWAVVVTDRIPGVRRVVSEVKGPERFGSEERVTFLGQRSALAPAEKRSSASDMRTSAEVKLRLLTTSEVPSSEISVDTDDGVVILFGIVPTAEVKKVAGVEAAKVASVTRVQNQLEVVPSSQKKVVEAKDADITRDLVLAFKDHADLKSVDTSVKNGVVRLTGTVESAWDEMAAVRVTRQVPGVKGVEDQLKVQEKAETSSR
jgi:hyperosmotically inducible periplasmic protein